MVAQFEGLRLQAYQDAGGKWTCGYGTTAGVTAHTKCSAAEALAWLRRDLEQVAAQLSRIVHVELTQKQFDALCSLTYNVGTGAAFQRSHLCAKLNAQNPDAPKEMLDWCYVTLPSGQHVKLPGLERRRQQEYAVFTADPFPTPKKDTDTMGPAPGTFGTHDGTGGRGDIAEGFTKFPTQRRGANERPMVIWGVEIAVRVMFNREDNVTFTAAGADFFTEPA
jgi:lysozyme